MRGEQDGIPKREMRMEQKESMLLTEARSWNPHALAGRWDPVDVVVVGGSPFLLVSVKGIVMKQRRGERKARPI